MKRFATMPAVLGLGFVMLFATATQAADVPTRMSVQALLLDKSGKSVTGSFDITFSLWDKGQGGNQLWAETQTSVLASQGLLDVSLGADPLKPILVGTFANSGQVWLQLKVESGPGVADGGEDPLPRRPFSTVGFAFHAQNAVNAANAAAFAGKTYAEVTADMLKAVAAEGYIKPGVLLDQSNMPPNGLNEVSNGLLTNQFTDKISSPGAPITLKDFNPVGVADPINFPDIGIAEDFNVAVNISNSDLNGVTVNLYAPNGKKYVLYDKNGPGSVLGTSYPKPTKPNSGDLTEWIGKNPKGTWQLEVIDMAFNEATNPVDGKINSWSISVSTLSTKKAQVKGNLLIKGDVIASGNVTVKKDLTVGGALSFGTGATIKGDVTVDGKLTVSNLADPVKQNDIASKHYVDKWSKMSPAYKKPWNLQKNESFTVPTGWTLVITTYNSYHTSYYMYVRDPTNNSQMYYYDHGNGSSRSVQKTRIYLPEKWRVNGSGNNDEMSVSGYLTKNPEGTPVHSVRGDIYTVPSGRNFVLTTIKGYQQTGHYVRYRIPGKNWAYMYNYHTSNTDYVREVEMHFPPKTQIDCEGWNRCAWSGYHYAASAVVDQ